MVVLDLVEYLKPTALILSRISGTTLMGSYSKAS